MKLLIIILIVTVLDLISFWVSKVHSSNEVKEYADTICDVFGILDFMLIFWLMYSILV